MKILAFESSCDETAVAVVEDGRTVLSDAIASQADLHALYGGVVPEIASRKHIEKINQVIEQALADAHVTLDDITAIAVTYGPGLVGALLVGVSEAKAISFATGIPLVGVHHIEGHISANFIENKELEPPFICLVASGGHSHLVVVKDYGEYEIIGRTRDDAAGEAFDKVARAIGLGYPGGPKIDKVSKEGNPDAIHFPRAAVAENEYDFSFSGLKSAVLNYLNGCQMKGESYNQADVAASFQKAVVDVLVSHSLHAVKAYGLNKFAIAGGVAGVTVQQAMRYGVARGLFSNEAGMGSTPHAHALANVDCPHDQGVVAMIGVFIDTFLVLTLNALVIISTLYTADGPLASGYVGDITGVLGKANLAQTAFGVVFGESAGNMFVAICLFFFAFSTILSWNLFGKINVSYLFGKKSTVVYTILALVFIFLGTMMSNDLVWELSDMFNNLMVIPNAVALFALTSLVVKHADDPNRIPGKK